MAVWRSSQTTQSTLDLAGSLPGMIEIMRHHVVAQDDAGAVGDNVLKDMADPIAAYLLFVIFNLQFFQQPFYDIAPGEDTDQFTILVNHRKTAKLILSKVLDSADYRFVSAEGHQMSSHPLFHLSFHLPLRQGLDQILDADDAYQFTAFDYRGPRDAMLLQDFPQLGHGGL